MGKRSFSRKTGGHVAYFLPSVLYRALSALSERWAPYCLHLAYWPFTGHQIGFQGLTALLPYCFTALLFYCLTDLLP